MDVTSLTCEVKIAKKGDDSDESEIRITAVPPEGTGHRHDNHPAFKRKDHHNVREAFQDVAPIGVQLSFLENYDYPYQFPTVAEVEWKPEYDISDIAENIELTDEFTNNQTYH